MLDYPNPCFVLSCFLDSFATGNYGNNILIKKQATTHNYNYRDTLQKSVLYSNLLM